MKNEYDIEYPNSNVMRKIYTDEEYEYCVQWCGNGSGEGYIGYGSGIPPGRLCIGDEYVDYIGGDGYGDGCGDNCGDGYWDYGYGGGIGIGAGYGYGGGGNNE